MEFISLQHQLCCREEQNKEERGALCLNPKLGNGNKMPLIARVKTLFFTVMAIMLFLCSEFLLKFQNYPTVAQILSLPAGSPVIVHLSIADW